MDLSTSVEVYKLFSALRELPKLSLPPLSGDSVSGLDDFLPHITQTLSYKFCGSPELAVHGAPSSLWIQAVNPRSEP